MKNTHKLYTDVIAKSGSKNEPLEVTANGVYEAPKGTGYSPVKVNVPQTAQSGTLKALLDATKSTFYLFYNYRGTSVDGLISRTDTSSVMKMRCMFYQAIDLTKIPQLDTSKATDMSYMFYDCHKLTSIPQLDTSSATNMESMLYGCNNLTNIPQLDTSNVTNMSEMFENCIGLTSVPELNASVANSLRYMFKNCTSLTSIGLYGFRYSIDISSTALGHDAIVALLNQAGTAYDSSQKITMGADKLALLSDEEKAIATNKGWTLA